MIWKNRIRTNPLLRKLIHSDGTEENVTIDDIPTNVTQNGTPLNENNLNIQEKNIGTYGDDTYDNTKTYSIGDIIIYQGLLYKCIIEVTTPEEFNNNHWEEFSLLEKIKTNERNISVNSENIITNTNNIESNSLEIENLKNQKLDKINIVKEENTDLNDYVDAGIYYFSTDYTPVNIPSGINGWLIVLPGNSINMIKQIWFRHGTANTNDFNTYIRTFTSNAWGDWTKYITNTSTENYIGKWNDAEWDVDTNNTTNSWVLVMKDNKIQHRVLNVNINNALPTVLYNNTNGSNGKITLSQTAANFTYLEIFFRTNDNAYGSVKVYSPNGKLVSLLGIWANNTVPRTYFKMKVVKINGTSIENNSDAQYAEMSMNASGTYNNISKSNNIYITRVIGFKY